MSMSELAREIANLINAGNKTSPYDTVAKVKRIEEEGAKKVAYVHIPGGVEETPVQMTVSAAVGDVVHVRVSGGRAHITGNASAPPTDDAAAIVAQRIARGVRKDLERNTEALGEGIEEAAELAGEAMKSANGKNAVFHQTTQPSGGTYKEGDTWFDTNDGYKMYTYDGSAWVAEQFGNAAIADLSITNAKIANATIQSAKIQGLDVGKLTGGYIDASHIRAADFNVGDFINDGTYSSGKISSVTTGTRQEAYSVAIGHVGAQNYSWSNVTAYGGVKGDMVLIPFQITDRDNAAASMLCRVRAYAEGTLYTDNLALMMDASANKYVTVISGYTGVCVHDAGDSSNFANVNSDGLHVYKSGAKISSFQGTYATLGGEKAIVKYSEDGSAFGLDNSHRIVVAKRVDEAGYRNDATLSSREMSTFDVNKPMAFFNATHLASGNNKLAQAGLYAWGGEGGLAGLIPSYVILQRGQGTGEGFDFEEPGLYISAEKFIVNDVELLELAENASAVADRAEAKADDNKEDIDVIFFVEPNAEEKFVVQSHSVTIPAMNEMGQSGSSKGPTTVSFTKSEHYPLAIVGHNTNDNAVLFAELKITSVSYDGSTDVGSVSVEYRARNTKSNSTGALSAAVDILWVKYRA